ncbi:MAG: DNA polymerase I, partial [Planctomycetes bacterium]|nr:DNA polymerase I [Planctomycetota bacterium]
MNPVLYLIDGHAQIFRAYYAMESLKSPHGVPTGAAFGFTRMLQDLISVYKPDGLAVCLDAPGKNFRHERYADYKATRKTTPPELVQQVPYVIDIVNAFRIPIFSLEGYEADDLLGSLARQAKEAGWDTVLVTGDKDAGQLLCENVRILDPMKNIVIDHAGFTEKKGLPPDKLVDLMGLWGDSSDNIPGVPGIGEKIGVQLIQEFGSLENLLENADLVKGKRGEVLRANKEQALMSKELATIDCHAPVTLDLELIKPQQPDVPKLRDIFTRLDFRSLLKRLEEQADPGSPPIAAAVVEQVDYRLINNEADLAAFMAEAMKQPRVAVDTETTGLDPLLDKLVGMSFSWQENSAYYLAFRAPLGETALPLSALETVRPLIESETIAKTGHNLKFDALVLRRAGLELKNGDFDTCIASSLSDGHLAEHGLKTICRRYYNVEMTPIEKLIGSGRNQTTMDLVPTAEVAQYAAADADISFRLYNTLSERLDERGARSLFENVEMPLSRLLTDMQWTGIGIDCDLLARESAETGRMLDALTAEIYQLAGHQFNIGSPKQLAVVLFEEHGLPVVRKTQTGA